MKSTMRTQWSLAAMLSSIAACLLLAGTAAQAAQAGLTQIDINMPVDSTGETIQGQVNDNGDGTFTVIAGGNDTWDNRDSFTFLYEERTGDFDVRVQIINIEVDDARQQDSAKAALHVRSSLDDDAGFVMIDGTPESGANYVETIFRKSKGTGVDDPPVNAFFPKEGGPYDGTYRPAGGARLYSPADGLSTWLRMRRLKNTIQTYVSANGRDWKMLADYTLDPAEFPSTLYLGLGTVAHIGGGENPDNRVRSTYANYGNTPAVSPTLDGETPVDPSVGPGAFPNTKVLAANWKVVIPADGKAPNGNFIKINADNKNEVILTLDSETPGGWAAPGYNQGDLDISLNPRDPAAAVANLGPYSNPTRSLSVTDPASPVTQAWIPSTRHGVVLATVRKNSQVWNDDGAGGATPPFSAFASVSVDFSSRKGFGMEDGVFQNGEIYVSVFKLGDAEPGLPQGASPFALREANIDIATAWFPFAQGWKAGSFADATKAPNGYWLKMASHSADAAEGTTATDKVSSKALLKWLDNDGQGTFGGLATLILPGVIPATDGMLFTVSNDDESDNEGQHITAAPFDDGANAGWTIGIRQDDTDPSPVTYTEAKRSEFSFVYIPYTAGNLIGGHIAGTDGAKRNGAGEFSVKRLEAGRYELTLPGKTGQGGMLILQNAGWLAADPSVTDDATLSYEYAGGNTFIVQSHVVVPGGSATGGDAVTGRDTDFYFAWVDFANPLTPSPVVEPGIVLQTATSVAGPYADEPAAVVNAGARTITLPKGGNTRFYRTVSGSALKLKSVTVTGDSVQLSYE